MKCPICKGKGEINPPKRNEALMKKEMAKTLLKAGFGIRETQRFLQYKSPRSIQDIKEKLN